MAAELTEIYKRMMYAQKDRDNAIQVMNDAYNDLKAANRRMDSALEELAEYMGLFESKQFDSVGLSLIPGHEPRGILDIFGDLF